MLIPDNLGDPVFGIGNILTLPSHVYLVLIHHSIFGFNFTFVGLLQELLAG